MLIRAATVRFWSIWSILLTARLARRFLMSMASELSLPTPRATLVSLRRAVIPEDAPGDALIQLIITVDNSEVKIRQFSAYLSLIDRTYGRLSPQGLASYSHTSYAQLGVSFQRGSLDIIISELLSHIDSITAIVVLRYLLKYLPTGVKEVARPIVTMKR
jgi:hypothetical protein